MAGSREPPRITVDHVSQYLAVKLCGFAVRDRTILIRVSDGGHRAHFHFFGVELARRG